MGRKKPRSTRRYQIRISGAGNPAPQLLAELLTLPKAREKTP